MPRADRTGPPPGDRGPALGGGAVAHPGLRRVPPAARDPQGLLRQRRRQPRLPGLPRQARAGDGARRRDRLALRRRRGLRRLDPLRDRLRPVPQRGLARA